MQRYEIKNHIVIYDDESHEYFVDGNKCLSVTQYLKTVFPNKYCGVDEDVLKQAANKGNNVHNAIELYEELGLESNNLKEFRDYLFLKNYFKFEVLDNERIVLIPYGDTFICGRFDLLIKENNLLGLADIKCTSVLDKEWLTLQLNLYKIGYEYSYDEEIKLLRGLHLKNGKRKYVEIKIFNDIFEKIENIKKGKYVICWLN